jgi:exodeoxyribonuclease V alpha subunit
MRRGVVGTNNLNKELQQVLNPSGELIERGGRSFRVTDKVMQIRNDYDKEVFNGDVGRIVEIDDEMREVTILIDDRYVLYDYSELDEVVLAYAVSVHKSQGSEYPAVVMPLLTQHYVLLQRNLLYTGVTRGKKLVVLLGSRKALAIAVRNNRTQERYTYLNTRLSTMKSSDLTAAVRSPVDSRTIRVF